MRLINSEVPPQPRGAKSFSVKLVLDSTEMSCQEWRRDKGLKGQAVWLYAKAFRVWRTRDSSGGRVIKPRQIRNYQSKIHDFTALMLAATSKLLPPALPAVISVLHLTPTPPLSFLPPALHLLPPWTFHFLYPGWETVTVNNRADDKCSC